MADAMRYGGTLGGHSREKHVHRSCAPVRSTISELVKDSNGHRIATGWKVTGKRERRITKEAGQDVAASEPLEGADKTDGDKRIPPTTTFYTWRR